MADEIIIYSEHASAEILLASYDGKKLILKHQQKFRLILLEVVRIFRRIKERRHKQKFIRRRKTEITTKAFDYNEKDSDYITADRDGGMCRGADYV